MRLAQPLDLAVLAGVLIITLVLGLTRLGFATSQDSYLNPDSRGSANSWVIPAIVPALSCGLVVCTAIWSPPVRRYLVDLTA